MEDQIILSQNDLDRKDPFSIEKNLMVDYFHLCQIDFDQHMKTDTFWILRVGFEEILLHSIHIMPHSINSPMNVVYELASKDSNFTDLLDMLMGLFPTSSMHRMMFSGYMKS